METSVNTSTWVQECYSAYRPHFIHMGLRLGFGKEELGDIISQFFLDLLEKNIDPRSIQHPKTYLSTAFRRKLVDHYRSRQRISEVCDTASVEETVTVPSVQDTLEAVQSNTELISKIRRAFDKLPNRSRQIIYLKFYEGLSTDEIALRTGLEKRTVYNQLHEGIKFLRKELSEGTAGIKFSTILSILPLL